MNFDIPEKCPICGGKLEIRTSDNGIEDLFCVNEKCPAKFTERITAFLERLGVMGVSLATVVDWNLTSIKDIVDFKANPTKKSETNFVSELEKKMWNVSKRDIFVALSAFVYGVGRKEMKKFFDNYGGEDMISNKSIFTKSKYVKENAIIDALPEIYGYCDLIFNDSRYVGGETKVAAKVESTKGTICFTGKLETMTRSMAQAKAVSLGYEIADGVSKTLGTLVVADAGLEGAPSSKLKKAMSMGIRIMSESEFNSL